MWHQGPLCKQAQALAAACRTSAQTRILRQQGLIIQAEQSSAPGVERHPGCRKSERCRAARGARACSRRSDANASAAAYARCAADSGAASQLLSRSAGSLARRRRSTASTSPAWPQRPPHTPGRRVRVRIRAYSWLHTRSALRYIPHSANVALSLVSLHRGASFTLFTGARCLHVSVHDRRRMHESSTGPARARLQRSGSWPRPRSRWLAISDRHTAPAQARPPKSRASFCASPVTPTPALARPWRAGGAAGARCAARCDVTASATALRCPPGGQAERARRCHQIQARRACSAVCTAPLAIGEVACTACGALHQSAGVRRTPALSPTCPVPRTGPHRAAEHRAQLLRDARERDVQDEALAAAAVVARGRCGRPRCVAAARCELACRACSCMQVAAAWHLDAAGMSAGTQTTPDAGGADRMASSKGRTSPHPQMHAAAERIGLRAGAGSAGSASRRARW